jgi:ribulose-bisphosphate carboxylase large chain
MESVKATYVLEFQIEPVERALDLLLAEMTCGIQYVSTRRGMKMDKICESVPYIDDSVKGELISVERLDGEAYRVQIGVPASIVDVSLGGISNLWPIVAGEVFNFHFIKKAALTDLELPRTFRDHYLGPRFGIPGVRELLGIHDAPLFGSILKPNVGIDPERAAGTAGLLARAGFDFLKDDEICVNPAICPLESRVRAIGDAVERASQEAGRKILYCANVTSDVESLGKAAEKALGAGAGGLMIDPFCAGLSSVDFLRRRFPAPLYAHRVGYGLFCLGQNYSVSFEVFSMLFRLLGVDFSHVGGIWGVSESSRKKTGRYLSALREGTSKKPVWPVITGISLENMREYHEFYGDDAMYMDHNDVYRDEGRAREKLASLKKETARR